MKRSAAGSSTWRSEQIVAAIFEASPLAIITRDLDHRVTGWNPAAERLFGWTAAEVIGRPYPLVPPERNDNFREIMRRVQQGEFLADFETQRLHKDGSRLDVSISTAIIRDEQGQPAGTITLIADITERKRIKTLIAGQAAVLEMLARGEPLRNILAKLVRLVEDQDPNLRAAVLVTGPTRASYAEMIAPRLPEALFRAMAFSPSHPSHQADEERSGDARGGLASDLTRNPGPLTDPSIALDLGLRACWWRPLRGAGGQDLGTFVCFSRQTLAADSPVRELVERAAHIAGIAIERNRQEAERAALLAQEQAARAQAEAAGHRLALLAEAGAVLASSLDYPTTLAAVVHLLVPRLADWCILRLIDGSGDVSHLHIVPGSPDQRDVAAKLESLYARQSQLPSAVQRAIASRRAFHLPRVADRDLVEMAASPEHLGLLRAMNFRSLIIVPLIARDRFLGAASLMAGNRTYTAADMALAEDLARRCAVAVDNARLYAQAQAELTERERTEAELRQTQARIVQQERLRALGEMAAGIAHDLNNTLQVVTGLSELLSEQRAGARTDDTLDRYLPLITTAAHDAAIIVNRLRAFYRQRDVNDPFTPVDLARIIDEAVHMTQPRWRDQALEQGATIQIEREIAAVPPIEGDAAELREALTNLIFNAVDALPEGGTIRLRLAETPAGVQLDVQDTGIGMSEDVRQRCLEPFFTTKGERGTGLGLPLVYGTVRRHGGTLHLASQAGAGTTVHLTFPRLAATATASAAPVAAKEPVIRSLRVLLVDDEPDLRELLQHVLQQDGHQVTLAGDGQEALGIFAPDAFDLVITDKAMPHLHGLQLAAEIKRRSPHTPIVLLTGFGVAGADQDDPPATIDHILPKPVRLNTLRHVIQQVTTARG